MTDMIHHKSDNTSLSSHKKEVVKGGFIKFYRDFQDWYCIRTQMFCNFIST